MCIGGVVCEGVRVCECFWGERRRRDEWVDIAQGGRVSPLRCDRKIYLRSVFWCKTAKTWPGRPGQDERQNNVGLE